jgi:hypothetical protein
MAACQNHMRRALAHLRAVLIYGLRHLSGLPTFVVRTRSTSTGPFGLSRRASAMASA